MGTFTKSFGAMGGYIAGSREFVGYLRHHAAGSVYEAAMSPVVAAQVLRSLHVIMGRDGTDTGARKLAALKDNANYFRQRLRALGAEVYGDDDSPVIPIMLYNPTKIAAFSREALARGLAVVVVGFPATPLLLSRVRFCISAGHTRETLDWALEQLAHVIKRVRVRYHTHTFG
jgi:serine palmitoyltransferase